MTSGRAVGMEEPSWGGQVKAAGSAVPLSMAMVQIRPADLPSLMINAPEDQFSVGGNSRAGAGGVP